MSKGTLEGLDLDAVLENVGAIQKGSTVILERRNLLPLLQMVALAERNACRGILMDFYVDAAALRARGETSPRTNEYLAEVVWQLESEIGARSKLQ